MKKYLTVLVSNMKKNKQKGFSNVLLIIVVVVFVGITLYFIAEKKSASIPEEQFQPTNTQQIVTKDRSQISKDGAVTLSAKKIQTTVEVQVNKEGKLLESFTYEEPFSADDSGNTWTGLPPSITLSPDGMKIAYSDIEGLKILDLSKKITRTIKVHFYSNNPDKGNKLFLDPSWFPDSKHLLYYQTAYEGASLGIADSTTEEYNDSAISLAPSTIELIQVKGKIYIIYSTSQSNDIYGGTPGLFVAEVSSIQNIKFINLIEVIKINHDVDITSVSYDDVQNLIIFEFYRDYYKETKTKYRGTISLDGSNFSETKIQN